MHMIKVVKFTSLFLSLLIINMNDIYGQDWPNLERFRLQNEVLKQDTTNTNRIVFMGNSITEGWLNDSKSFFYTENYINRGISGQTTPQMLIRFKSDVVELKPALVLILAGINDIAENTGHSSIDMIMNNITSMAEISQSNDVLVILCSVLPASSFPWRPDLSPSGKVIELNRRIKAYSEENDHIYLDYFSSMVDQKNGLIARYSDDGVHPNLEGYRIMQPLAENAIRLALNKN